MKNLSFEDGWYDLSASNQIPKHWKFQYDGARPESNIKHKLQLPEDERDLFITDGEYCLKVFSSQRPCHWTLEQNVDASSLEVSFDIFVDVFNWQGEKVKPGDPWAARVRIALVERGKDVWSKDIDWVEFNASNTENFYLYPQTFNAKLNSSSESSKLVLRVDCKWGLDNNGVFIDNFVISDEDNSEEVPEEPPEEVDYKSIMLVLPQDATKKQLQEIFDVAYPERRTFGFSHDDAGHLNGTAILYNISEDKKSDYLEYYKENYPNVNVKFAYTSDYDSKWEDYLLWQCDPKWRDYRYSAGECGTICRWGCWICTCAMAMMIYGIEDKINPKEVDERLDPSDYYNCSMKWTALEKLGLKVDKSTTKLEEVKAHLDSGDLVFVEVSPSSMQHFVLAVDYSKNDLQVLDPLKNEVGYLSDLYSGYDSFRLISEFEEQPDPPVPEDLNNPIGLHLQAYHPGDALDYYISNLQPQVMKTVQNMQCLEHIKALSPDTLTVYRHYTDKSHKYLRHPEGVEVGAREYLNTFKDSLLNLKDSVDYVESLNEQVPTNNPEKTRLAIEFDVAFAQALNDIGLPAKPLLCTVAVGNPGYDEVKLLLPAAEAVCKYDGAMGYHNYWYVDKNTNSLETYDGWKAYAGRALENWDKVFTTHGLYPNYIFSESGPFKSAWHGWKAEICLDANKNEYIEHLKIVRNKINKWNKQNGNRALGLTLFTVDPWGWDYFQHKEDILYKIANSL
jgi:hypothetical protein